MSNQHFIQNAPPGTVVGRLPTGSGPCEAIPHLSLLVETGLLVADLGLVSGNCGPFPRKIIVTMLVTPAGSVDVQTALGLEDTDVTYVTVGAINGVTIPTLTGTFPGWNVYEGFSVQPTDAGPNIAISPAVEVTIYKFDGTVQDGLTGNITVALGKNPTGATLSGTLTQPVVSGVATFNDLSLDRMGTGFTLLATALDSINQYCVESAAFDLTATLVFTTEPSTTAPNTSISPAVVVTVQDPYGATITSYTGNVTVAISTNPASGTLSGTLTVACVAGVATFSDLQIDNIGDGYVLSANSTDPATGTVFAQVFTSAFNIDYYTLTIAADTSNYDVYNEFVSVFGTPPSNVALTLTINSGVVVSCTGGSGFALSFSSGWTGTPTFTLVNNGYIIGAGGSGNAGGKGHTSLYDGIPGDDGVLALALAGDTTITNGSGFIWGGGGAGGSGGGVFGSDGVGNCGIGGAGGSGGAGNTNAGVAGIGDGVLGGNWHDPIDVSPSDGNAPTGALISQTGGAAALGGSDVSTVGGPASLNSGDGGAGGDYGQPGSSGQDATYVVPSGIVAAGLGGAGGAAGDAIATNGATITWISGSGSPNVKGAVS